MSKTDLTTTILALLEKKQQIRLPDIAEAVGLSAKESKNRRAIQRALVSLIDENVIRSQGSARARYYTLNENSAKKDDFFKDIPLSKKSNELLYYLSQPIRARQAVGYHQEFLKSYKPNEHFYLSSLLREKFFTLGQAENMARPAGTYARHILNKLLIDLSWNSSRLEGNTYSLLETKRLIELGEVALGKDATETQMILNHKAAIEYIIESVDEKEISSWEIRSIHALLSENLLGDPGASGRVRELSVGMTGTAYSPLDNPHVLKDCFDIFVTKLNLIKDPFEQSFFALTHLSYLQAFEDVNKRTARLVANIPLIKNNLKPLSFIDVDQQPYITALLGVYEKNDVSLLIDFYSWAYEKSAHRYSAIQQSTDKPNLFKLKYRVVIQDVVRTIILENIAGSQIVSKVHDLLDMLHISQEDISPLFQTIETEIMNLHEGNIARFKIRPSEFHRWKGMQK